jgi:hypothetical protein
MAERLVRQGHVGHGHAGAIAVDEQRQDRVVEGRRGNLDAFFSDQAAQERDDLA